MTNNIFDEIKAYKIKPDFSEKEFLKKIVLKMAHDEEAPLDIFDLEFDKVELYYTNSILRVEEVVRTSYKGSIGYDRKEEYWDKEKKYSSNGSYLVDVKKTRTITDWHPYEGNGVKTAFSLNDTDYIERLDSYDPDSYYENITNYLGNLTSYKRLGSRVNARNILNLIDENKLKVEKVELKCSTDTRSLLDKTLRACEGDIMWSLHNYYETTLPGDQKNLRFTDEVLEIKEVLCFEVPQYTVSYTYKGEKYKCYMDAIPDAEISYELPKEGISKINEEIESKKETKKKTLILNGLMKISWCLAFAGLVAAAFAVCFMDFYFGWVISAILIVFAICNHKRYDKKFYKIYKDLLETNILGRRGKKLEKLSMALERNGLDEISSKELPELKAYEKGNQDIYVSNPRDNTKVKPLSIITIVALVALVIFSLISLKNDIHEYNYSPDRISIEWVDKQKTNNNELNLVFEIESEKKEVSSLTFEIIIYKNGEEIGSLTGTHREIKIAEEKTVTFVWKGDLWDSFYNTVSKSELSELTYEIVIKEIWFDDNEHYTLEE